MEGTLRRPLPLAAAAAPAKPRAVLRICLDFPGYFPTAGGKPTGVVAGTYLA